MLAKVDQVRRLLAEGYVLDDVALSEHEMEARFRRDRTLVKVRFAPSEAEALLLTGPLGLDRIRPRR